MDGRVESLEDAVIKAQLKRQARRVYIKAMVFAGALTLIALVLPGR